MSIKKILISVLALSVLTAGGIFWSVNVNAETTSPQESVIDKLVERFNLDTDEVKSVFTEVKQESQQEMLDRFAERLSQAVEDGVITEEQKQALLSKQGEMMEKREQLRAEWQTWADDSGIDFGKLREYGVGPCGMGLGGKFGGRGFGGRGFRGW